MSPPSKLRLYAFSAGAGLLGRTLELGSGFAIVWLLTRVLDVAGYGRLLIGLTLAELCALASAGGLEALVLYRSSRSEAPPGTLDDGRVASAALGWGLLIASAAAALLALAAPELAELFDDARAAPWIRGFAALVPIYTLRTIYASWHRARQRIPQAVLLGYALPRLGSAACLAAVALLWPTHLGVKTALIAGPLLVLLPWFATAPLRPRWAGVLEAWDLRYAAKLSLNRLLAQGLNHSDVLLLGLLSTSAVTGQYGVASRVAHLTLLVFTMLLPIFAARIGYLHGRGQLEELAREYDQTRNAALLGALAVACGFGLLGPEILALFGDFEAATPVLWILAATGLAQASFGMNRSYLGLAGYGSWTLAVSALLLTCNIVLGLLWIPGLGGVGAALATLVSIAGVRGATSWVVWRLDRFPTYSLEIAGLAAVGVSLLLAGAAASLPRPAVGLGLGTLLALFGLRHYRQWSTQLGGWLQERP